MTEEQVVEEQGEGKRKRRRRIRRRWYWRRIFMGHFQLGIFHNSVWWRRIHRIIIVGRDL